MIRAPRQVPILLTPISPDLRRIELFIGNGETHLENCGIYRKL